MVFPLIIMGALTGASLLGQALIPTKISSQEKKEIIEQAKTQIKKDSPKSFNAIFQNKNILLIAGIVGLFLFILLVFR